MNLGTLVAFIVFFVTCFAAGYYLLPWLMHGVSPRETWRRDHDKEGWR